jgi:DNA mismatch repair protein MutS
VLLTGPNRGGKSTFCKAIGISVVCAQTWGFAWAASMSFYPYTAIETALSPADELGRLSLFEAEIEFAKEVLYRCEKEENTLVMMDEIFHSTNARDGVAASHVFLDKLYSKPRTTTLISTHYRELVEHYKEKGVLAWAMDAKETETGLEYSYRVTEGISDKSSVMEILKERGLV